MDDEEGVRPRPTYDSARRHPGPEPAQPKPARVRDIFGFGGGRHQREPDLEMGDRGHTRRHH
jgi:hypothetical protein